MALDELDRLIVAALQMDGRASWTAVADMCDTSVPTVARRAQQLIAGGLVRVAVVSDVNSAGPADLFVVRISCAPGQQGRVCEHLVKRDDVRFLAELTGSTDVIVEMSIRKDDSLRARLVDELQVIAGVMRCDTDLVLHMYKVAHDWSRQLLTGEQYAGAGPDPHECDPSHFDGTDDALLALLRTDGRASFRTVALALGVNESTVKRRFERLNSRGCVSVVTLVPASALGFESELIFKIAVVPSRLEAVARELAAYRGVRYVASTLDGSSLMCEVILPTTSDIFSFVTQTLGELEGVNGWVAGMELLTYKRGFVETPWWRSKRGTDRPKTTDAADRSDASRVVVTRGPRRFSKSAPTASAG